MDARRLLAWNLRRRRVQRGLSQEQLAVDATVNRTYVSGLERAQENPTIEVLERLARALSIQIGDLLAVPPPKERPPKPLVAGRKRVVRRQASSESHREGTLDATRPKRR